MRTNDHDSPLQGSWLVGLPSYQDCGLSTNIGGWIMTTEDTALTIAVELLKIEIGELVLQKMRSGNEIPVSQCTITSSEIDALFNDIKKDALAQPAQEPYGWMFRYVFKNTDTCTDWKFTFTPVEPHPTIETKAVYTHPAPSWQGLDAVEISKIKRKFFKVVIGDTTKFARAIEQASRIKNGY